MHTYYVSPQEDKENGSCVPRVRSAMCEKEAEESYQEEEEGAVTGYSRLPHSARMTPRVHVNRDTDSRQSGRKEEVEDACVYTDERVYERGVQETAAGRSSQPVMQYARVSSASVPRDDAVARGGGRRDGVYTAASWAVSSQHAGGTRF